MTQWGLDTLFNPAKRHMDDEKRRLQSTREEAGDSSGGKRIDLASGKVVIRRDAAAETEDTDAADAAHGADGAGRTGGTGRAADAGSSSGAGEDKGRRATAKKHPGRSATGEPSAAAIRAARRRGRAV